MRSKASIILSIPQYQCNTCYSLRVGPVSRAIVCPLSCPDLVQGTCPLGSLECISTTIPTITTTKTATSISTTTQTTTTSTTISILYCTGGYTWGLCSSNGVCCANTSECQYFGWGCWTEIYCTNGSIYNCVGSQPPYSCSPPGCTSR